MNKKQHPFARRKRLTDVIFITHQTPRENVRKILEAELLQSSFPDLVKVWDNPQGTGASEFEERWKETRSHLLKKKKKPFHQKVFKGKWTERHKNSKLIFGFAHFFIVLCFQSYFVPTLSLSVCALSYFTLHSSTLQGQRRTLTSPPLLLLRHWP